MTTARTDDEIVEMFLGDVDDEKWGWPYRDRKYRGAYAAAGVGHTRPVWPGDPAFERSPAQVDQSRRLKKMIAERWKAAADKAGETLSPFDPEDR